MQGRLQVDQTTTAPDLAQALENEQGSFLVQQGGQAYIALSKVGHSIVSFRPIGPRVPTLNIAGTPENWFITKLSDSVESFSAGAGAEQARGQSGR